MDLAILAATFGAIFIVELPDKTFIAALVLSTRYRPLAVWLGVGAAFGVQCLVAVTVGTLATLLPDALVKAVTLLIFLIGALVLIRTAPGAAEEQRESEAEYAGSGEDQKSFLKAAAGSFVVLFAAEWGDLSQLLTISFVTRYHDHVNVFLGAWLALLTVSGLAVLAGRVLLRHMKLSLLHYIGAAVCLLLAAVTVVDLVRIATG